VTLNGTPSGYTVAATSNRLTSVSNPTRSFVYDSAGNTTSAGSYTATYNLAGRLSTLSRGGVTTTYAVDGFGRRVRKFDSRGVTNTVLFVYDQQGQLLVEYSNTGAPIREYVWLGSTPVAMFVPNPAGATLQPIVYYVHTDHLDTPRALLDTAGNLRWTWLAEPFGNTAPNANPAGLGAGTMNLRHPGQYADAESGLFYNYFRDYDPSLGRYTQSDPIGLAGGINTYAYVEGNPMSLIDPMGLFGVADLPTVPQSVVDAVTGFGDSFLIPELIRDALDIDGGVSQCSAAYRGGKATGFVVGSAPFLLRGAAALGGTRLGHALNHNRYLRMGPGRMPANSAGMPAGTGVPRMSIGPQIKGGPPNPHADLRSRFPYAPPIGGPAECGCP
jgi:RHS repeat-associated protein